MILLSLDTCDPRGSVAVLRDGVALQVATHDTLEEYSSWLLPTIGRLLTATSLTMADMGAYAVAVGPGSFTGVRVGLTTVKAWGEVHGRPIAPVSRLEAVASQSAGDTPFVAAFMDGSRGQVFGALYAKRDGKCLLRGEESVMDPESFLQLAEQSAGDGKLHWISSDPQKMQETALWKSSTKRREPIQVVSPYLAEAIGMIGYKKILKDQTVDGIALDANYVRRPDAEVFWKGGSPAVVKKQ
ncbi:MAG: tRNA (adenosine(37)-N6)-threonylcarbamoyltransferase complex dimerization subunit type 1 TsaB [Candidatus Acidiferrum sp.]